MYTDRWINWNHINLLDKTGKQGLKQKRFPTYYPSERVILLNNREQIEMWDLTN